MSIRIRILAVALFASLFAPGVAFADKTVEIFNGKDLKGWIKRGGEATYRVENGEIVGRSAPNTSNTFLCTPKEYANFELEYDFKIDDTDFNSGVQIRSHSRPERREVRPAGYSVDEQRVFGYQVEIDPKDRSWSGGIYFEGGSKDKNGKWIRKGGWLNDLSKNDAARKAFKLGEWNHIKVVAKGRQIQTWINGVPAADFTDTDDKAFTPSGLIAFQVHGVGSDPETKEIRWRNIKLTELD
jgi:hypothetical protein